MYILYDYDAFYHSFYEFFHWYAILLKSIFLHYLGLIMCFIDVWSLKGWIIGNQPLSLSYFDFSW